MYVCVEGVIGVGKTTLVRMLSKRFGIRPILEIVEENPFLANFYVDRERWAFQTQLFFLLSRYSQQEELLKIVKKEDVVSDYMFDKDRLFAQMNLFGDQLSLYERVYGVLESKVPTPDLIVYLKASVETLMERISMRDRLFERSISKNYISNLVKAYDGFFSKCTSKFVTIDADKINFVRNERDFNLVISKMKECGIDFGKEV